MRQRVAEQKRVQLSAAISELFGHDEATPAELGLAFERRATDPVEEGSTSQSGQPLPLHQEQITVHAHQGFRRPSRSDSSHA